MADLKFEKEITGLLLIDPYNDFISEGGKIWDRIKAVAEANDCVPHMLQLLTDLSSGAKVAAKVATPGTKRMHFRSAVETS